MPAPNPPPSCRAWASPSSAGVETVRSLTSLAILTGSLGKPSVGVNPVRGQNNVQGACDMGALPDPIRAISTSSSRRTAKIRKAWGVESLPAYRLSHQRNCTARRTVKCRRRTLWVRIRQTDAELSAVRKAFDDLDWLSSGHFMTKPASAAGIILPSHSWGEHERVYRGGPHDSAL
ncbi:molybdopterin-dependent oxidoreductase [Klebsiella quasipneumoniae subsp. similipneumoniae]